MTDSARIDPARLSPGTVHRTRSAPITTTQLVMYAGASGDFNRIHFDEPFARSAGLKGVIAHGMLTMAIAGSCITELAGPDMQVAHFSARFLAPVLVGDEVDVEATVREGGQSPALDVVARVGEKVVLQGEAQFRAL
jgi:acyl dehydratase